MAIALNSKEQEMLAAVIKEMGDLPAVDFAKVALVTGQKYPKNARSAFKRIWDKLKNGPVAPPADNNTKPVRKQTLRAAVKKSVGPKIAPRKASTRGSVSRRKVKKEESEATDGSIKADGESDNDVVMMFESHDDDGFGTEAESAPMAENGNGSGQRYPVLEDDEMGAMLLGVSIEEYRELAIEASHRSFALTPPRPDISDDDAT